jgi:hypothetical protein
MRDFGSLDSYPQGFDCSNPTEWASVITDYNSYHESEFLIQFNNMRGYLGSLSD